MPEITLGQLLFRRLAGFDLLGVVDFLLGSQEFVLTDRREVLADEVGGQPSALVGELVAVLLAARARQRVAGDPLFRFFAFLLRSVERLVPRVASCHVVSPPTVFQP